MPLLKSRKYSFWFSDAICIWSSIGSGNVLLSYGTKPLSEPILIKMLCGIHQDGILLDLIKNLIHNMYSDFTVLELLPHQPGANEKLKFMTQIYFLAGSQRPNSESPIWFLHMMTSSSGNMSRVTGHLCGKFTDHRWIPRTKASDAERWCFLWSAPE